MTSRTRVRLLDEDGAAAVEYGLVLALVAGVVLTAVTALGGGLEDTYERTCKALGGGHGKAHSPAGVGGGLSKAPGQQKRRC